MTQSSGLIRACLGFVLLVGAYYASVQFVRAHPTEYRSFSRAASEWRSGRGAELQQAEESQ